METKRTSKGMRTGLAMALVAAVAVVGAHGVAGAMTLCKKPSGVLAARDGACKKKEEAMPATAFQGEEGASGPAGPEGPAGPSGAPGAPGAPGTAGDPAGPRAVDSTGKAVGVVDIDVADVVMVTFPNYGPARVEINTKQVFSNPPPNLYHESNNCSDAPLALSVSASNNFLQRAWVLGDDLWLPGSPADIHTVRSFEDTQNPCTGQPTAHGLCCHSIPATPTSFIPVVHFDVSATVGTPPFSLH